MQINLGSLLVLKFSAFIIYIFTGEHLISNLNGTKIIMKEESPYFRYPSTSNHSRSLSNLLFTSQLICFISELR